jgi:hypothetical protein
MKHIIEKNRSADSTEYQFLVYDDAVGTLEWKKATIGAKPGDFKKEYPAPKA